MQHISFFFFLYSLYHIYTLFGGEWYVGEGGTRVKCPELSLPEGGGITSMSMFLGLLIDVGTTGDTPMWMEDCITCFGR